jgi:hypothetical protein
MIKKEIKMGLAKDINETLQSFFEMSSLYNDDTGIGTNIWIEERGDAKGTSQHDFRIKAVANNKGKVLIGDACSVIIDRVSGSIVDVKHKDPKLRIGGKEKRNLQKWILLNLEDLILHWDRKISSVQFIKGMKRL